MDKAQEGTTGELQLFDVSGVEDRKSEAPQILVMILAVVLLLVTGATLAVLANSSSGGDENGRDVTGTYPEDDASSTGTDKTLTLPPADTVIIALEPRMPPSASALSRPEGTNARTLSATHPPGLQTCRGRKYLGKLIGNLDNYYTSDVDGYVYAASEDSIFIDYLTYDGTDLGAHFWAEYTQQSFNAKEGDLIPDENGRKDVLKAYNEATIYLRLPKKINAYRSLGIYSNHTKKYLGYMRIRGSDVLPGQQSLGKPSSSYSNAMADDVVLTDSSSMILKGFVYDGKCPHTYFVTARTAHPPLDELTYLTYDSGRAGELGSYNGRDVTIQLPCCFCSWNRFSWFHVFCVDSMSSLMSIKIDISLANKLPVHNPESAAVDSSETGIQAHWKTFVAG